MGNRTLVRLAAAAAGGLLALAAAAPALAADPTQIPLKDSHKGHTAQSGVDGNAWDQECGAEDFNGFDVPDGHDGWHFVAPSAGGNPNVKFTALTLTFDAGVVTIDSTGASGGLTGWIRDDQPRHAYLFTPAGWTLEDGVADVIDGTPAQFNVSHTCPGEPGEEDDEPGDEDEEEPGEEDEEPGDGDDSGAGGEQPGEALPVTGSPATRLAAVGAILLTAGAGMAAGVGLLAVRRRRRLSNLADD